MNRATNFHRKVIEGFGDEWVRFDQTRLSEQELQAQFEGYFSIFPWHILPADAEGFDLGCGSGRWAKLVAPRVGRLHCIDLSEAALNVARRNLAQTRNCVFHNESVDAMTLEDGAMDFGYALGVLHHLPDTQAGLKTCVEKLKPGAPFLLYVYYSFDNRPFWFAWIWRLSNVLRGIISRFPYGLRYLSSQLIALFVYLPLASLSRLMEVVGVRVTNMPLSAYRNRSLYSMRTDALDRLGTRLEKRFSREQIKAMMEQVGLERIEFSPNEPFWCAVGYRCHSQIKCRIR